MDSSRPSELEFERVKRDAAQLLDSDAHHAYMALGALAAVRIDVEGIHSNFNAALKLDKSDVTYHNYAAALAKAGEFEEALPLFKRAQVMVPEDLTALGDYIRCAVHAGNPSLAFELLSEWDRRSPAEKFDLDDTIREIQDFLHARNISQESLQGLHRLAFDVMRKSRIPYEAIGFGLIEDGSTSLYSFDVCVQAEAADALDLNLKLASALAGQETNTFSESVSISFSPAR